MKFYGNANLQQNELQNVVIPIEDGFPLNPKVGQLANVNRVLSICISIEDELPVWVPITREITLYTHTQDVADDVWTITHGLNTQGVQVQVFDNAGHMLIPDDIAIINSNTVEVTLATGIVGRAVILTGHNDGIVKPTYSYVFYQQNASDTWVIVHNLGYNPIVRVFVGANEVQPQSITHDSVNEMTITFSQAVAGLAKLV